MEIIIKGTSKEIADLAQQLQDQQFYEKLAERLETGIETTPACY